MTLRSFVTILRRNWLIVAICALLAVVGASIITYIQHPIYSSSATAYVSVSSAGSVTDLSQGGAYVQQIVSSFADVGTTQYVLQRVATRLSPASSVEKLQQQVRIDAPLGTVLLNVTASDQSPSRAAKIANYVTQELARRVSELSPGAPSGAAQVTLTQLSTANPAAKPESPNVPLNVLGGLLAGLILGVLASVLRQALDVRLRDVSSLRNLVDTPVLGSIFEDKKSVEVPLVVQSEPLSAKAEAFRTLKTNLRFLDIGASHHSYVVTSSIPAEGKTTSTANLAIALAEAGSRTLVVDADLRRPSLAQKFGIDGAVGLTNVLLGEVDLETATQRWGLHGLSVLPAGQTPPNPNELIQSTGMAQLLEALREQYDVVLIDTPPLLAVSDGAAIAKMSSGVILIAGVSIVRRSDFVAAADALRQIGAPLLGVVATRVRLRSSDGYQYGYSYSGEISGDVPRV